MGLFDSLASYLILYLIAIFQCPVSLARSCSAQLSLSSCLLAVCLCLEDQTGASCLTSSAASLQSQISVNCFNNNTRGGLDSHSDRPETRAEVYSITLHPYASEHRDHFHRHGQGGATCSTTEKNIRAEVTEGENRDGKEEENPIRWRTGYGIILTAMLLYCSYYRGGTGSSESKKTSKPIKSFSRMTQS